MINIHIFILLISFLSFIQDFKSTPTSKQSYFIEELPQPNAQSVLSFKTKIDEGTIIKCLVYIPNDYSQSQNNKYPLLIFLHGSSESGDDLEKVKKNGPPKLISQGKTFPFIVISPQLPMRYASKWPPELIDEVYNLAKENFRIDEDRFYLTGVSVGGAGTWTYALTYPDKVAAIAPICGWGNPSQACEIKDVPTWAFHGAKDKVIDIEASRKMINSLKKCGADPQFTIYPNAGHDSWTVTYNNPALYKWFLSHSKSNETIKKEAIHKDTWRKNTRDNKLKKEESQKQSNLETIKLDILSALPTSLKESSGLIAISNNSFWTHNDSGHPPVLFNIDSAGKIIQIKRISNATNFDWEDLTSDEKGNFYIGDFGNNKNNRRTLQIYKIPNPENIEKERIEAEMIEFSFPDQTQFPPRPDNRNFDMEAMVAFKDSLYLFSKNNSNPYSGYCKMYRLSNTPGKYMAELVDSVFLGNSYFESSITGATLSKDLKYLVLLSYSKLYVFSCFKDRNFFNGHQSVFLMPNLTQKEGISFLDNENLYITDEQFHSLGGNLYKVNMNSHFKNDCP